MADRAFIDETSRRCGVGFQIWGRAGEQVLAEMEQAIGAKLGEQVAEFIRTVGNVGVGGSEIALAGTDDGLMTALAQTDFEREYATIPRELLKIMDSGGETSYFLQLRSGEVLEFLSYHIVLGQEVKKFKDFDEFITWVFEEAKAAEEWGREHWPEGHEKRNERPADGTIDTNQVLLSPELEQQYNQLDQQFKRLAELLPPDEEPPHQQT